MDKSLEAFCKLLLLAVSLLFAPIWIPVAVVVTATTVPVVGGILTALAMVTFTVLSLLLGVIGLPVLLLSATVTVSAYIAFDVLEKIADKMHGYMDIEGMKFQVLSNMFSTLKRSWKNDESEHEDSNLVKKSGSWGNIPCYADENEVETETSVIEQNFQNRPFPFPRASLGFIGSATDNTDDVESFFDSVEQLYSVISSLRKLQRVRNSLRMRTSSRMMSRRRSAF